MSFEEEKNQFHRESESNNQEEEKSDDPQNKTAKLLEKELKAERDKNRELYDRYVRLQAEVENYKKRIERDKCDFYKYALEKFIKDMLPVLDNLELAIKSSEQNKDFGSFAEGIQMIFNQLVDVLKKEGLSYECAVGEMFDPSKHEAIMQIESKHHEKDQIVDEIKKGYFLKDRLLRPAMVTVAKKPEGGKITESDKSKTSNSIDIKTKE